jgi:hypothetical protein
MDLTASFQIDPEAAWVREHNAEARAVVEAWRADRPIRVPLLVADSFASHGIYADAAPVDYRRYYAEPEEMIRVQLEAARLRRELPIGDTLLGELPPVWKVISDFWPVPSPGWLGCRLLLREKTVIAHQPLALSRRECDAQPMPDPERGGLLATIVSFREAIAERCRAGLSFLGRPVELDPACVDHYGVLAMALDVRGHEFLADLYDEPDWARAFLLKMAEWCDALERVWKNGSPPRYFRNTDHGIDMLSPATYEQFIVPLIVEMNRRRGTGLPTGLHHCGRGAHLFPVIKKHFPLQRLDDLAVPTNDLAAVRRAVGDEVWIKAELDAGLVQAGPPERISQAVKDVLVPAAKGRGRLAMSAGDLMPGTPLAHRIAYYEAVKEFGTYAPGGARN